MNTLRPVMVLLLALLLCGADISAKAQSPAAVEARTSDLYVALGQKAGIQHFTRDFIVIVLADDRIKSQFDDTDMDRLTGLIAEQLCDLAGGPCEYSGKDMKSAHAGRKISTMQFNALAEDLQIAMENDGVSSSASNQLIAKLAPMYGQVTEK